MAIGELRSPVLRWWALVLDRGRPSERLVLVRSPQPIGWDRVLAADVERHERLAARIRARYNRHERTARHSHAAADPAPGGGSPGAHTSPEARVSVAEGGGAPRASQLALDGLYPCEWCGTPIRRLDGGRPRQFHSDRCRRNASRWLSGSSTPEDPYPGSPLYERATSLTGGAA